jgi:GNAT superfamily N-acetyltransferase
MPSLQIDAVESDQDLNDFINFPWKVYASDPYWVPPIISDRRDFLDPEKNAFFEHARAQYFVARRDGDCVGTIAAFTNDFYNQFQEVNTGFFGFFEVLEDPQAAAALLRAAEEWARKAGHDSILGPAQFSTNDECGLLVDGFDDPPRVLMTYNPPYYADYLINCGYGKVMDLWAYRVDAQDFMGNFPLKLRRVVEKMQRRERFTLRKMNVKKEFDKEVAIAKMVYNTSWEKNWGFVPFTDREFDHLAAALKQLIDQDLTAVVECEGEPIGFGLCLPDVNQPLLKAYPRPGAIELITMLKFIWHWKVRGNIDWVRMFVLGTLPEYRGTGVDALMYMQIAENALQKGYKWAEISWVLESNLMMIRTAELMGGEIYKTYRMYEKAL